jgi:hypothetical protein
LAVIFAYLWVYSLIIIPAVWLAFIITGVIILIIYHFLWYFLEKRFNLKPFGFFSYTSQLNQSQPPILTQI